MLNENKKLEYRVLIVEDTPTDAELNEREIRNNLKECVFMRVDNEENFLSAIKEFKPDIIISDFKMPTFDGLLALKHTLAQSPITPFIIVTGPQNEDTAVECMKAGATDYVIKGYYKRLGAAVRSALEQKEIKREKERNKRNLQESEERLRLALAAANQGLFDFNVQTGETIVSPEYATMLGYDPEDFSETIEKWINRLHSEDKDRVDKYFHDYLEGLIPNYQTEFRLSTKSGQWKWILSSGKIVARDEEGKPLRMLGTHTDITRQKMVEEELKKAWVRAEEADRLKTAFLHNISHEIRTPMNAIVGFANLLEQEVEDDEKRKHYTDIICMSSNQLLCIITDLINIATIEAGQEKVNESATEINKLIQSLYNQYEYKIDTDLISFTFKTPLSDEKAVIYTDETKLLQIFSNLIGNAIKFTKLGSIQFGYEKLDNFLKFYVIDTGIGIPAEFHSEIFERFCQANNNISRNYGGTGLGLAISKSYVELMGGKIWLESEPSKGSAFYFTIPYKPIEINKTTNTKNIIISENYISTPKKIMIAEDEEFNYMLIEELLLGLNFTLIRAKNGLEAIEICKMDPYIDLVLMDIKMPIMNGYEATQQIKKMRPKLPVIALTAYTQQSDRERAMDNGCDDYISKPIIYDQLYSVLIKFFEKQPV
jgi:PAS domain S-box-containing protein